MLKKTGYVMLALVSGITSLWFPCPSAHAEVSLEAVVQAGNFTFYRDSADEHKYYYVPDEPRLAQNSKGRPEFTFIKYHRSGAESAEQTRGGLVHFLVTWGFDEKKMRAAQGALQQVDRKGKIAGPVPFKEATFAVVSASAGKEGIFTRRIVGEGKGSILPGQKAAVSIALDPPGATVLWESFRQETSEVSVVFLMKFAGLTPAYQAKLKVHWDKVYKHHDVNVGVTAQIKVIKVDVGVRAILDDLRQSGAIELEETGENPDSQGLLRVAYGHIVNMMFDTRLLPPDAETTPSPGPGPPEPGPRPGPGPGEWPPSPGPGPGESGPRPGPAPDGPAPLPELPTTGSNRSFDFQPVRYARLTDGATVADVPLLLMGLPLGQQSSRWGQDGPGRGGRILLAQRNASERTASTDLMAPYEEPYIPPPATRQNESRLQTELRNLFQSAANDYGQSRFADSMSKFNAMYDRGQSPPAVLGAISWNIYRGYLRLNNVPRAFFFLLLSRLHYEMAGESENREQINGAVSHIRNLRERIQRENITLPPGVARLADASGQKRLRYAGGLTEARRTYFLPELGSVKPAALDAISNLELSEPYLWIARAEDRLGNRGEALEYYRRYAQRLQEEGGDTPGPILDRIRSLTAARQTPSNEGSGSREPDPSTRRDAATTGRSAGIDLMAPYEEPYVPPVRQMEQFEESARGVLQRGRDYYDQGRYRDALRYFHALYERTDFFRGTFAYNLFLAYRDFPDVQRALLFAIIARENWSLEGNQGESRDIQGHIRTLQGRVRREHLQLPPGIARLNDAPSRQRNSYFRNLAEARGNYFSADPDLEAVKRSSREALRFLQMSEPYLWLARAEDRSGNQRQALDYYRRYLQRLQEEGGEAPGPVQRRIRELSDEGGPGPDESGSPPGPGPDEPGPSPGPGPDEPGPSPGPGPIEPGPSPGPGPDGPRPPDREPQVGRGSSGGGEPRIGVSIQYVYRKIRHRGTYTVDIRKRLREERNFTMAGNIGGFMRGRFGEKSHFLLVDLDDPAFRDRTIEVVLDGQDYEDMKSYVNAVSVQFQRRHDDNSITENSVKFFKEQFAGGGNRQRWVYPKLNDGEGWLKYQYRVNWQFYGGAEKSGEWQTAERDVLTLTPVAQYRTLRVAVDQDDLSRHRVRAVAIQFRDTLFGKSWTRELLIANDRGDPLETDFRYLHEPEDDRYEVRAIWTTNDGKEIVEGWKTGQGQYVLLRFPK